jgi:two-component system LytT family response regulator
MTLKCVIIDDEPLALDVIAGYVERTPFLSLAKEFTHPVKAFDYLSEHRIDIVFIDIQMPDLSGLDLIRNLDYQAAVIFTTAFDKYAIEGFKVDAVDYLLKPVDYPEFLKAVEKAKRIIFARNNDISIRSDKEFLFLKSEYKTIRINLDDIKYIEGKGEYIRVHLVNQKPIMSLISLTKVDDFLPSERFMRVHRSFIVNLRRMTIIERNRIVFDKNEYIPVSEQYKQKFQEYINRNFMV